MNTTSWLIVALAFTAVLWMPYVLHRMVRIGIVRTLGNPSPQDDAEQAPWALRARAAHANAVANIAHFAPIALLAVHFGAANDGTATSASAVFVAGRVVHYLAYAAGALGLRTVSFLVAFAAEGVLLSVALRTAGAS